MLNKAAIDALVALLILSLAFGSGWLVKGWREDSKRLDQVRADAAEQIATMTLFESAANKTLTELQAAKGTQTIIKREVIREVEKYRDRPCFDSELVRVLNDAAGQKRPDVADGEVRADPAGAD